MSVLDEPTAALDAGAEHHVFTGRRDLAKDRAVLLITHRLADVAVADRWGRLNAPDLLPVTGGLLAATALVHGLTLVTRNTRDVERSGVQLLNPFG